MFSTLTSHPNNGNLLYLLDFLGKWVPVGLWNFFASKVNEKRWLRVSPPLTAPWLAPSVCVRVCARVCVCEHMCTHSHAVGVEAERVMPLSEDVPPSGGLQWTGCCLPSHLGNSRG